MRGKATRILGSALCEVKAPRIALCVFDGNKTTQILDCIRQS